MDKTKKATASDTTRRQRAADAVRIAQLEEENARLVEEDKLLRKQNVELANIIETDLKADVIGHIMAMSDFKQSDLESKSVDDLQMIEKTLTMGKPMTGATYKNIRAGTASEQKGPTTVGSLKGKTREEILAMGGDF